MSQKSRIFNFDIRKLSILKFKEIQNDKGIIAANQWFHFPQRSDISINFFIYLNTVNSFHISITWKGSILVCCSYFSKKLGTNDLGSNILAAGFKELYLRYWKISVFGV